MTNSRIEMFSVDVWNAQSSCLVAGAAVNCSTREGLQHWSFDRRSCCASVGRARRVLAAVERSWRRSLTIRNELDVVGYVCRCLFSQQLVYQACNLVLAWYGCIVELLSPDMRRHSEWIEPSAEGRLTCRTVVYKDGVYTKTGNIPHRSLPDNLDWLLTGCSCRLTTYQRQ